MIMRLFNIKELFLFGASKQNVERLMLVQRQNEMTYAARK
jgi:hypothetical protein